MSPADFAALRRDYGDVTRIGYVEAGAGEVYLVADGVRRILPPAGWAHFTEVKK